MEINQYEAQYTYDNNLDIINIELKKEHCHKCSIELEFGVILDFDVENIPINLEIISASKIIDVNKTLLANPNGNVTIIVGLDIIEVVVDFEFENSTRTIIFKSLNDLSLATSQSNFALA